MTNLGIIEKIKEREPTEWVNSLIYRQKANGRLRFCLDPTDLNRDILREHHKTPTLEEILPNLSGAKYFSILDAKCGYWNVVFDKESSRLTTFNSPFGRYKFLRMPFGLKMSQDIFQSKIDQTFEGCSGVIGIAPMDSNMKVAHLTTQRAMVSSKASHTIQPALLQRQKKQKIYHDRNAKQLPPLSAYQNATVQSFPSKNWEQATIVGDTDKPRSYTIFNNEGNELRRNRNQIRPIQSPPISHHGPSTTAAHGPSINPGVSQQPAGNNETQKQPPLHNQQKDNTPVQMPPMRSKRVIKAPQRLDL
ncbi:Pol polyprotein [Plakobranchus ocellatus]|uniref:Pol polyprotein n=1 Tax=Plakobranchus ocellatus TaxID=259542 RepID=A0AAV4AC75_9GAST|nr:Pol polyprotein [Plakobranchus ocellatus]